jgi:hypothetical protein
MMNKVTCECQPCRQCVCFVGSLRGPVRTTTYVDTLTVDPLTVVLLSSVLLGLGSVTKKPLLSKMTRRRVVRRTS